tara:strand:+ start:990 stop:1715 length:726 start_codon:yes stop_codon:yes gene_type:complete
MLTQENIHELNTNGYKLVNNFVSIEEVDEFLKLFDFLEKEVLENHSQAYNKFTNSKINVTKDNLHKVYNYLRYTKFGKEFIDKILESIKLINSNLSFWQDKYMAQAPGVPGYSPHQDNYAGDQKKYNFLNFYTVIIALTSACENTGCLWVENGPKRTSDVAFCSSNGCSNYSNRVCHCIHGITPELIKNYKGVSMKPIKVKSRDTIFMDGNCVHGTAINLGNNTRRSLILQFKEYNKNEMH